MNPAETVAVGFSHFLVAEAQKAQIRTLTRGVWSTLSKVLFGRHSQKYIVDLKLLFNAATDSNKRKFDYQLITYPVTTRRILKSKKILKLNYVVSYDFVMVWGL